MVTLPYSVLNAFTKSADSGNPAAVIILPPPTSPIDPSNANAFDACPPTEKLQKVATQLNYPMTAFLLPLNKETNSDYLVRWIDPGTEVMLCGHATVALSHHLFSLPGGPKRLNLTSVKHGLVVSENLSTPFDQSDKRVGLDFPQILGFREINRDSTRWTEVENGLKAVTKRNTLPIEAILENPHYVIVEFQSDFDMSAKGLPLDMPELKHFEGLSVLLTQATPSSATRDGPHIHSRVLHALAGKKDEDAATGSAHCALIPYYLTSQRHQTTFHADAVKLQTLSVVQQSAEGGEMVVQWLREAQKVRIYGNAVPITEGEVEIDL